MRRTRHRTRPDVDASPSCIICDGPADEADSCCSPHCAFEAERELKRNATNMRRMQADDASPETRRELSARSGKLSSALMRWRPQAGSSATAEEPGVGRDGSGADPAASH